MAITCVDGVGAFDFVFRTMLFRRVAPAPDSSKPGSSCAFVVRGEVALTDDRGDAHLVEQGQGETRAPHGTSETFFEHFIVRSGRLAFMHHRCRSDREGGYGVGPGFRPAGPRALDRAAN